MAQLFFSKSQHQDQNKQLFVINLINQYHFFQIMNNDFEDKATRLFNRLNSNHPIKSNKSKESNVKTPSPQELQKIKEEIQSSDFQARKKMRILNDNLKKLQTTLIDQNQNRAKMDETFTHTIGRLQKNMKNVLNSVNKSFAEKQKKLQEKIEALIKIQRKQIEYKLTENDGIIQDMLNLQTKVLSLVEQIKTLRKSRTQLQQKITKQFNDQIRELKHIFQNDVKQRQQKQTRSIFSLKQLYKTAMQRISNQQKQRQQNEKMLITVVEQLVNHIMQT